MNCQHVSNLKTYILLIVSMYHTIGKCSANIDILELNTNRNKTYCAPSFQEIRIMPHVIYFIDENNSKEFLEDCLMMRRSLTQPVTLLSYDDLYTLPNNNNIGIYHSSAPDVVIYVPEITIDIFEQPIPKLLYLPHNSMIFIISTTINESFACHDGVFNENGFKIIDHILNRLWHNYKMFNAIVELPFKCPGYYLIYKGKRPTAFDLYDRTIISTSANCSKEVDKKLSESESVLTVDYPLRANTFERFPTSIYNCGSVHNYFKLEDVRLTNGMCGMDAFVMHDVLHRFGFKVEFPNIDAGGYGYINTTTGIATGSIAKLLQGDFDISFNSRFMAANLDNNKIKFLNYISYDSVCAALNTPDQIPLWHYPYNLFRPIAWLGLVLMFATLGIVAKGFSLLRRRIMKRRDGHGLFKITDYILLGMCGCIFNKRVPASVLAGTCLLISSTLLALYQSNVNYMYTTLLKYHKINTLEDLHNSGTLVYTSQTMLAVLGCLDGTDFVIKTINKSNSTSRLRFHSIATLERKLDMSLEIMIYYTDKDGHPLMYFVNECYSSFFLSYIARQDFPFTGVLRIYIMRLLETGLPEVYYRWMQYSLIHGRQYKFMKWNTEPRPFYASTMQEQRVAFILLFGGFAISSFIFVIEIWWAKRRTR